MARERKEARGLVIVNTGDGKGKTTASIGLAVRAAGNGLRVLIIQFIKGRWKTGESQSLPKLAPNIQLVRMGSGDAYSRPGELMISKYCSIARRYCSGTWPNRD